MLYANMPSFIRVEHLILQGAAMRNSSLFNQLISFAAANQHRDRFNYEAIGIYLQHQNEKVWHNHPVYLAAGSEDLRVLLARLPLQLDGDEAYIFVRPYVHAMLVSMQRISGKLVTYVFDPQGWGLRYYPTRLIIQALIDIYPDNHIFLSMAEIQSQSTQRGCTEYTLACLDYLLQPGNIWMSTLTPQAASQAEMGARVYQLLNHIYPECLKELSAQEAFEKNVAQLEQSLNQHYKNEDLLNKDRIKKIMRKIQGFELIPWQRDLPALYNIEVKLAQASVVLQFPHKDYVHANCLIYTTSPYPLPNNDLHFVLKDNPAIKVLHDANAQTLSIQAKSIETLQKALEELAENSDRYRSNQMHQELGLRNAIADIKLAIDTEQELQQVMDDKKGGMDARQVLQALRYIFRNDQSDIYIPHYVELSGADAMINLDVLRDRGFSYLLSTIPVLNSAHQVAIKIDLADKKNKISVYDSESPSQLVYGIEKRLKNLFTSEIIVIPEALCFKEQSNADRWSCGVHVIANVEAAMARRSSQLNTALLVKDLAKTYLQSWRYQQDYDDEQAQAQEERRKFNADLYEALCKHPNKLDYLIQFLSGFVGNKHSELQKATPLHELLIRYTKAHAQDKLGQLILKYCLLSYPRLEEKHLASVIVYGDEKDISAKAKNLFDAIKVDLQLELNDRNKPLEFLREALIKLIKKEDPFQLIQEENRPPKPKGFLKFINCGYSIEPSNKNPLRYLLMNEICQLGSDYDEKTIHEKKRKQRERQAKNDRVRDILENLGISRDVPTHPIMELSQQPEHLLMSVNTKLHQAILNIFVSVDIKIEIIKKFISLSSQEEKGLEYLLDTTPERCRLVAAMACMGLIPFGSPQYLELRAYILEHTPIEKLEQQMQEWRLGVVMDVTFFTLLRKRGKISTREMRTIMKAYIQPDCDFHTLLFYRSYLFFHEIYSTIRPIMLASNAIFFVILFNNDSIFEPHQYSELLTDYSGSIDAYLSKRLLTPTAQLNIGWDAEKIFMCLYNKYNCQVDFDLFVKHAPNWLLESSTQDYAPRVGEMVATYGSPIHPLLSPKLSRNGINQFLKTYSARLKSVDDFYTLLHALPETERYPALQKCSPLFTSASNPASTLFNIMGMLSKEHRIPFVTPYLDTFETSAEILYLLKIFGNDPFVLIMIERMKMNILAIKPDVFMNLIEHAYVIPALKIMLGVIPNMHVLIQYCLRLSLRERTELIHSNLESFSTMVEATDSEFLPSFDELLSNKVIKLFIERYLLQLSTHNIPRALRHTPELVVTEIKRGRIRIPDSNYLGSILLAVNSAERYFILQKYVGLIKRWSMLVALIRLLPDKRYIQFIKDYEKLVRDLYLQNPRNTFCEIKRGASLSREERRSAYSPYYLYMHSYTDLSDIIMETSTTDEDRIKMLWRCNIKYDNPQQLYAIINIIPPTPTLFSFLLLYRKEVQTLAESQIIKLADRLQESDRLLFLSDTCQPVEIINYTKVLPEQDRFLLILSLQYFFVSENIFWKRLQFIDTPERILTFGIIIIKNSDDLVKFCASITDRFPKVVIEIAKAFHHLVNAGNMIQLMRISPEFASYIFNEKRDLIDNTELFAKTLSLAPPPCRFSCASLMIKDFSWLVEAMPILTPNEANSLLLKHIDKVTINCNIAKCLIPLAGNHRFEMACLLKDRIGSPWQFERVLKALKPENRYDYVKLAYYPKLLISPWLKLLPPIDRYDFALKQAYSNDQFIDIVECLAPEHRLNYVNNNFDRVSTNALPEELVNFFDDDSKTALEDHWQKYCKNMHKFKSLVQWCASFFQPAAATSEPTPQATISHKIM
jgi:hypothetical protein